MATRQHVRAAWKRADTCTPLRWQQVGGWQACTAPHACSARSACPPAPSRRPGCLTHCAAGRQAWPLALAHTACLPAERNARQLSGMHTAPKRSRGTTPHTACPGREGGLGHRSLVLHLLLLITSSRLDLVNWWMCVPLTTGQRRDAGHLLRAVLATSIYSISACKACHAVNENSKCTTAYRHFHDDAQGAVMHLWPPAWNWIQFGTVGGKAAQPSSSWIHTHTGRLPVGLFLPAQLVIVIVTH